MTVSQFALVFKDRRGFHFAFDAVSLKVYTPPIAKTFETG